MRHLSLTLALLLLWVACPLHSALPGTQPVRLILDTDMSGDCDDAGALALLHALADRGECELLATIVDRKDLTGARTAAKSSATVDVWPEGKMPGNPASEPEAPAAPQRTDAKRITNISRPTLTLLLAPKQHASAPAMIVCPGGGYGYVVVDKEGTENRLVAELQRHQRTGVEIPRAAQS